MKPKLHPYARKGRYRRRKQVSRLWKWSERNALIAKVALKDGKLRPGYKWGVVEYFKRKG